MQQKEQQEMKKKAAAMINARNASLEKWRSSAANKCSSIKEGPRKLEINPSICLLVCTAESDLDEVNSLLDSGVDVNFAGEGGLTALHQACINDDYDMVELLIKRGANVNIADHEGYTPLHAGIGSSSELIKLLLDKGADPTKTNIDGDSPADMCTEEHEEIRELLEKYIKKIDQQSDIKSEMSIFESDVSKWIANRELNDIRGPAGDTPLHFAVSRKYLHLIKKMIDAKINVNAQDNDGWTPLHYAVYYSNLDAVKMLVEAGADIMATENYAFTPINFVEIQLKKLQLDEDTDEECQAYTDIKHYLNDKIKKSISDDEIGKEFKVGSISSPQLQSILVLKSAVDDYAPTPQVRAISRPPTTTSIKMPPGQAAASVNATSESNDMTKSVLRPPISNGTSAVKRPNSLTSLPSSSSISRPPTSSALSSPPSSAQRVSKPPTSTSAMSSGISKPSFSLPPTVSSTPISSNVSKPPSSITGGISKPPSAFSGISRPPSTTSSTSSGISKPPPISSAVSKLPSTSSVISKPPSSSVGLSKPPSSISSGISKPPTSISSTYSGISKPPSTSSSISIPPNKAETHVDAISSSRDEAETSSRTTSTTLFSLKKQIESLQIKLAEKDKLIEELTQELKSLKSSLR